MHRAVVALALAVGGLVVTLCGVFMPASGASAADVWAGVYGSYQDPQTCRDHGYTPGYDHTDGSGVTYWDCAQDVPPAAPADFAWAYSEVDVPSDCTSNGYSVAYWTVEPGYGGGYAFPQCSFNPSTAANRAAPSNAWPGYAAYEAALPTPTPTPTPSVTPTPSDTPTPTGTPSGAPVEMAGDEYGPLLWSVLGAGSLLVFLVSIAVAKVVFGR